MFKGHQGHAKRYSFRAHRKRDCGMYHKNSAEAWNYMETLSSGHALQLLSLPDDSHGGRCFHPRFQRYPVRSRATSRSHRTGHIAPQLYSTPSLPGSAFISNNLWKAANLDKYKWLPCHPQIGRDAKCSFAKHKYEMPRRLRTNVFRCHGYMFPLRFGHLDSKSAPF
ncbi:hypothetical protein BDR04DRAFT_662258 [Suillus decipiens]|nr:hypothetical protein BDR04DRAFT_662258 [Suillus decipiens]